MEERRVCTHVALGGEDGRSRVVVLRVVDGGPRLVLVHGVVHNLCREEVSASLTEDLLLVRRDRMPGEIVVHPEFFGHHKGLLPP